MQLFYTESEQDEIISNNTKIINEKQDMSIASIDNGASTIIRHGKTGAEITNSVTINAIIRAGNNYPLLIEPRQKKQWTNQYIETRKSLSIIVHPSNIEKIRGYKPQDGETFFDFAERIASEILHHNTIDEDTEKHWESQADFRLIKYIQEQVMNALENWIDDITKEQVTEMTKEELVKMGENKDE